MIAWWTSLTVAMKILWGITIVSSLIFVIETVMTFIGADADGGGIDGLDSIDSIDSIDDPSGIGSGANLYTFRNLVNFCLGFGWTAVLLYGQVKSKFLLIVIAALVGIALVAIVMYMFKFLSSMQQSGTIDVYKSAVGCQGKVYLKIPAERKGSGKVQITINNSVRDYDAQTDGDEIQTGTPINVVEVIDSETLLVEPKNSLII